MRISWLYLASLSERDMPTHWYNINADLPAAGVEMFPPRQINQVAVQ